MTPLNEGARNSGFLWFAPAMNMGAVVSQRIAVINN
jgi:hypothetical protein